MASEKTVAIPSHGFADVDQERRIIEEAGFKLVVGDCQTPEEIIALCAHSSGLLVQFPAITAAVLDELKVGDKPQLLVLNQADKLDTERRDDLERRFPDAIFTSAVTGEGLDILRERIFRLLDDSAETISLELPAHQEKTGRVLSQIARHGRILKQDFSQTDAGETVLCVEARLAKRWWELAGVEGFMLRTASA